MEEIKTVSLKDESYPEALREIKSPPEILYYRGKLFPREKSLAVVGTRRCSFHGKEIASEITADLVEAGITIVSGLAPGIDTVAHKTALEKGGRTIAVLGTGLDEKYIYPKSNLGLSREIIKKDGLLLSEYPPETSGSKFSFPQRNRLISGLSLGVIVIEAPKKSGAVITAQWAKKQKRKIFAVPGDINSPLHQGCNSLIKDGAFLVENGQDILKKIGINFTKRQKNIKGETPEENVIIELLKVSPLHLDEIVEKTKLKTPQVVSLLSQMEMRRIVKNIGGNIFSLIK